MGDKMSDLERLESGLHVIDPEPYIDLEDPQQNNDDAKIPSPSSSANTASLGLSQHSAIWYLQRTQKYSSYIFSAFAAMHIANTSLLPLLTQSVHSSETYLLLTRPYYQAPLSEPLIILLPLSTHILSGLALRLLRRNSNAKRFGDAHSRENRAAFFTRFWPRVSGISWAGYALAPLVTGHMVINRVVPKDMGENVGLGFVSHAFARHPIVSYLGFSALLGVGCGHFVWGWAKWLSWTPEQVMEKEGWKREVSRKRRWYVINGLAAAVTGLWMAGSFGVVARGGEAVGWVRKLYEEMLGRVPVVGRWL